MFERFNVGAERAVTLAQEQAWDLGHPAIEDTHLLLGLLHEGQGVAARVLRSYGVTLDKARADLIRGDQIIPGHIPFTPAAKKCLELSLREALGLDHDYIGTEHLLLGILRNPNQSDAVVKLLGDINLADVRPRVLHEIPVEMELVYSAHSERDELGVMWFPSRHPLDDPERPLSRRHPELRRLLQDADELLRDFGFAIHLGYKRAPEQFFAKTPLPDHDAFVDAADGFDEQWTYHCFHSQAELHHWLAGIRLGAREITDKAGVTE